MSDEANVNESSEPESLPEQSPPGALGSGDTEAPAVEAADPGPPLSEPERKAEIQKAMRVTARENAVRKRDLKRKA